MVTAVIEQLYSSRPTFGLLKIQEICPLKRFIFTCKCTEMRLVPWRPAGGRPASLSASPGPLAELGEGRGGNGGEDGMGGKRGKKERGWDPPPRNV